MIHILSRAVQTAKILFTRKIRSHESPQSRHVAPQPIEQEIEEARRGPMTFQELGLSSKSLAAVEKMGYGEMTPIQEATYPIIMAGRDLCALAETGSGKTAACAIPLVQSIDTAENAIQGLIIVPTRELAIQYVEEIDKIGADIGVVAFAAFGGFSKDIQVAKIKHKVHVLVATPGRLIDLLYDGVVRLSQVRCVVLDEADQLLMEGFLEDIELIMSCILHEHQTLLFAATMDDEVTALTKKYLRDPEHITLLTERAVPASIDHYFSYIHPKQKEAELISYLTREKVNQAIIFCNARHKVDRLFRDMKKTFKDIEYIHAGLSQNKRSSLFRQFKSMKVRYLIATDVAGRGLDFTHVSHVINWDLPFDTSQYTHRTGRSGRMGRKGTALTFVSKSDLPKIRELFRKKEFTPHWIGRSPLEDTGSPHGKQTPKKTGGSRRYRGRKRSKPPGKSSKPSS